MLPNSLILKAFPHLLYFLLCLWIIFNYKSTISRWHNSAMQVIHFYTWQLWIIKENHLFYFWRRGSYDKSLNIWKGIKNFYFAFNFEAFFPWLIVLTPVCQQLSSISYGSYDELDQKGPKSAPKGRRGRDQMVVGFTTTCAIIAYHH